VYWRQRSRERVLSIWGKPEGYSHCLPGHVSSYVSCASTSCVITKKRFEIGGLKIQGEDDAWDFGSGAGFYIDATASPWSRNYKMETYITSELPKELFSSFPELDSSRVSITGHSMGGHGALTLFLKNPGMYKSVSAFSPIANPMNCPWGEKAFKGYLGENREAWKKHDATELIKGWRGDLDILIDVVSLSEHERKGSD
jgi:S-formylglutathione hydrolase